MSCSSPWVKFRTVCQECWIWSVNLPHICSAADRKTLQRTVNTAAKIIGAPLPSILDIFLARCSSKTNSIVKDPTHPSHSLFQLLPSGRRYRSIGARSARLLNSFFPQAVRALNSNHPARLWNPMQSPTSWNMDPPPSPLLSPLQTSPNLTTPATKTVNFFFFFVQSKCATHRWVDLYKPPVVTHSPLCTRHFSYTIPQKTQQYMYVYMLMHHYKSSCTVPQPAADSQCFSLHMYSIYVKHSHSLYFLSLSLVVQGKHLG